MYKFLCIFMAAFSIVFMAACNRETAQTEKTTTENQSEYVETANKIFTDNYFEGIKEVKFSYYTKIIDSETDIQEICNRMGELHLAEITDDGVDYKNLDGNSSLTFIYEDNTEKSISFTTKYLYCDDVLYSLEEEESEKLFDRLKELFQTE